MILFRHNLPPTEPYDVTYQKAASDITYADLCRQATYLLRRSDVLQDQHGRPSEPFRLYAPNPSLSSVAELDQWTTSTLLAGLCEGSGRTIPDVVVMLSFESHSRTPSVASPSVSTSTPPEVTPAASSNQIENNGLFITVDGNLSSLKGPFLDHLAEHLKVEVERRKDEDWGDWLTVLYKCTKNPESTLPEDSDKAFCLQKRTLEWAWLKMLRKRTTARVVEHSIFDGECAFRPNLLRKEILRPEQCAQLSAEFKTALLEAPLPDLLILLCVDPKKSFDRIKGKGRKCEDDVTLEYLQELEDFFRGPYVESVRKHGGTVIPLTVDREDGEATPAMLLSELLEKLRQTDCPRVQELIDLFTPQLAP